MTLETLITFLTIENNNMNNYIVTFEYRVMVTAFAILAMFFKEYAASCNDMVPSLICQPPPLHTMCLVSGEKFPLGKEALNRYFTPDMIKVPDGKRLNILQMEHTSFG